MKTKKWYLLLIIGILVLSVLACNISGDLINTFTTTEEIPAQVSPLPTQTTGAPSTTVIIPDYVNSQDTLVSLYQQLSPGVVSIQVVSNLGAGQGSGFVIDQQGHIVTNYHVVEGAQSVEVDFFHGA